jgi:hypothetical protein
VLTQQRELIGEKGPVQERDYRFGASQRQRAKPRPLASGEDDGLGAQLFGAQGWASSMSMTGMPSRIG